MKICAHFEGQFSPKCPRNHNSYCSRAYHLAGLHAGNRGPANSQYKPPVERTCEHCGKTFLARPWNASQRRWCPPACRDEAHRAIRGEDHPLSNPKAAMACEVCGAVRLVKPSLVPRFRACSRRCAAVLGKEMMPRTSALETAVGRVRAALGEAVQPQARIGYHVVEFYLPNRPPVIECDGAYCHSKPKQQRLDRSKDTYLRNRGIKVARLPEEEIRAAPDAAVLRALHG